MLSWCYSSALTPADCRFFFFDRQQQQQQLPRYLPPPHHLLQSGDLYHHTSMFFTHTCKAAATAVEEGVAQEEAVASTLQHGLVCMMVAIQSHTFKTLKRKTLLNHNLLKAFRRRG